MKNYDLTQLGILIVEQHWHIRSVIRDILKHFGIKAVWDASNITEAYDLIVSEKPDLVLSD